MCKVLSSSIRYRDATDICIYITICEKRKLLIYNLDAVVSLDGNSLSISSLKSCNFLKIIMGLTVSSCVNLLPSIS